MKDKEWCQTENIDPKLLETVRSWEKLLEVEYDVRHLTMLVHNYIRGDYSNGFCSFCIKPKEFATRPNCNSCEHAYGHGLEDGHHKALKETISWLKEHNKLSVEECVSALATRLPKI